MKIPQAAAWRINKLQHIKIFTAAILLFCCVPLAAQHRKIPADDFFRKPAKSAFQLSPDGSMISYLAAYEGRMNIWVQSISGHDSVRVTSVKNNDISTYFWKGKTIVFLWDENGNGIPHLFSASADGKKVKDLTPEKDAAVRIIDRVAAHENQLLIAVNNPDRSAYDPALLDIGTGKLTKLWTNTSHAIRWYADHKGDIRLEEIQKQGEKVFMYRASEKDNFRQVIKVSRDDDFTPLFFTADNTKIYASSNIGRDKKAIMVFDPATGQDSLLYENPDVDVTDLAYSDKRGEILYVRYEAEKTQYEFLDKTAQAVYFNIASRLRGMTIDFTETDAAEDAYIVKVSDDKNEGTWYLYSVSTNYLTPLASSNPLISENELSDVRPVSFTARDGMQISGYLTIPRWLSARNLPAVVIPHNSFSKRDGWRYDPMVQLLANRGMAVLQVNCRGTWGFGKKFRIAGRTSEQTMQNDLADGAQWLISEEMANPKKVGICGSGAGGYIALEAASLFPRLYSAAVNINGPVKLQTYLKYRSLDITPDDNTEPESSNLHEKTKDKSLAPLLTDSIKKPVLIILGKNNPEADISDADALVQTLKNNAVPVQYLKKDDEGRYFTKPEDLHELYQTVDLFLFGYL